MKKSVIIMNPESGKAKKLSGYKEFYDILRKYSYETEIMFTERKNHASEIIENLPNDIDLVISAGGDGTLNEVVTGNMRRSKKLVIANLPMGSTNDVANMYGYSKNLVKNLELLLSGKPKKIDVCSVNDTPFIYVACLGDYIDMAYNTPRELKKKYGKIAYVMYGLKQLRNRIHTYDVKYTIDGETHEGNYAFFFITNSSRVAGVNDIYFDMKLDDNKFEVAMASAKNKKELLKLLVMISTRDIKDVPGITYYSTDNFEIEFIDPPKTSWCIDGEEFKTATTKFKFGVEKCMKMMTPKDNLVYLFEGEEME